MTDRDEIPLARPALGDREQDLVAEVLGSGRLSLGPMLGRFERAFAEWLGVPDAVAVSSGTAALHLGVRRLGWGPGDRVVTSPLSFVASANCLLYEGVEPVFADVDPVSLNLDPRAVAERIDERTAGILPVHIFGHPAAMAELEALAGRHGLGLLEDACEALGSKDLDGGVVGARGNLATFAFYANKQLTTGEGGMLIPRDERDAEIARSERNQGRARDMGWMSHDRLGFNYRLTDLAAAIGVAQLERIDELLEARSRVAQAYDDRLAAIDRVESPAAVPSPGARGWFVYVVTLSGELDRDEMIEAMARRGIETKAYLPCIHLHPFYRERFGFTEGDMPVAEDLSRRSLALPLHPGMDERQVERVVEELAGVVDG